MKSIITVLNGISGLTILAYPLFLFGSLFLFDAPGSEKSIGLNILKWCFWTYPFFIGLFIFLSRKYESILFAVIAAIPTIIISALLLMTHLRNRSKAAQESDLATKSFICDNNSFLSYNKDVDYSSIDLYEKKTLGNSSKFIGAIYKNKYILPDPKLSPDTKDRLHSLLSTCKDVDGKSPLEKFIQINEDQIKDAKRGSI